MAFGLACDFARPEPAQARPKPGLSGQAGAGTSLPLAGLVGFASRRKKISKENNYSVLLSTNDVPIPKTVTIDN